MAVDVKEQVWNDSFLFLLSNFQLMDRSIQLLCLILEYRVEGERDDALALFAEFPNSENTVFSGTKLFQFNIFSRYIKSLKSTQVCSAICLLF
jgi:hypothetical protein